MGTPRRQGSEKPHNPLDSLKVIHNGPLANLRRRGDAEEAVEGARGLADRVDRLNKSVDVTVLDLRHDLATARATSGYRYQLFQLARIEGEWKIVNVLWIPNPGAEGKSL